MDPEEPMKTSNAMTRLQRRARIWHEFHFPNSGPLRVLAQMQEEVGELARRVNELEEPPHAAGWKLDALDAKLIEELGDVAMTVLVMLSRYDAERYGLSIYGLLEGVVTKCTLRVPRGSERGIMVPVERYNA